MAFGGLRRPLKLDPIMPTETLALRTADARSCNLYYMARQIMQTIKDPLKPLIPSQQYGIGWLKKAPKLSPIMPAETLAPQTADACFPSLYFGLANNATHSPAAR